MLKRQVRLWRHFPCLAWSWSLSNETSKTNEMNEQMNGGDREPLATTTAAFVGTILLCVHDVIIKCDINTHLYLSCNLLFILFVALLSIVYCIVHRTFDSLKSFRLTLCAHSFYQSLCRLSIHSNLVGAFCFSFIHPEACFNKFTFIFIGCCVIIQL